MQNEPATPSSRKHFPWVATILGAGLVVAGAASLLRLPSAPRPRIDLDARGPAISLQLAQFRSEDRAASLQEELALRDPMPLFLPTQWSSGQANLPLGVRREPGTTVGVFPPKLVFQHDDPGIAVPPPVRVPSGALAMVEAVERIPDMRELSRRELPLPPLRPRLARLVVTQAGGAGQPLIAEDLIGSAFAGDAPLREEFWAPIEALVAVSPAGMVGQPAVVTGSGSERVDDWAIAFLTGTAQLGARLRPGFYRVVIGP